MLLEEIRKEIEEKKTIWMGLEKPPYNEFEQELYLSGLRKSREIILDAASMERSEDCGGWKPISEYSRESIGDGKKVKNSAV